MSLLRNICCLHMGIWIIATFRFMLECSWRRHLRGCLYVWWGFWFYLWPTSLSKDFGSCQWFRKPNNFYVSKVVFPGCWLFHILKLVSAFRRTPENSSRHCHAFTSQCQERTDIPALFMDRFRLSLIPISFSGFDNFFCRRSILVIDLAPYCSQFEW